MTATAKLVLAVLTVSAVVALTVGALLGLAVPYDQVTLVLDGERIEISELTPVQWVLVVIGIWTALLVAIVVLPFVLVLALGLPLLAVAAVSVILFSPVFLVGLVLWWLWKRESAPGKIEG